MKYLLLFAVLFIAYMMWRNKRIDDGSGAAGRSGPTQRPLQMVSCQVCGLHLPKTDALVGSDGQFYCSQEHRQRAGR